MTMAFWFLLALLMVGMGGGAWVAAVLLWAALDAHRKKDPKQRDANLKLAGLAIAVALVSLLIFSKVFGG
jgi:uncharacterized membrane protein YidH (DUF202 family)